MKLKTQLSISTFILSSLLLLLALGIASHIHSSYRKKSAIERFQNSVSSFDEFKNSQIRVLSQSAEIISLEPAWVGLKSTHEQDWISRLLEQCQKKSGASQILLIQNGRITHSHPSINHASSSADSLKNLSGSLNRDDSAKKIGGLIAFQGKLHVFAMASVGQETSNSFLVFLNPFPIASISSGMDLAFPIGDGLWKAGRINLEAEDASRLNSVAEKDYSRITLGGGSFRASKLSLGNEKSPFQVILLESSDESEQSSQDFSAIFLGGLVLAAAGSFAIASLIARKYYHSLSLLADITRGKSLNTTVPTTLTERGDEIGEIAIGMNQILSTLGGELKEKEKNLNRLERYQVQLLDLNQRLSKKLFENRVLLTLWKEQEKSYDTKDFLSRILEELLQGLPFHYGCIIIRPLSEIGPEVILGKIERKQTTNGEIPVTDFLERSDRTQWLSSLSGELKQLLLNLNQESSENPRLLHETIFASIEQQGPKRNLAIISLQLAQGKQHMGSLHLISEKEKFSLSASEEEFLLSVAAQISVALENRSLHSSLKVDPLTRLYNRGYLNDKLREEMLRSSRTNRPFTFVLLDIDHFKRVNDTYGHPAGDDILIGIASLLKRSCRASDAICRYGGEEIAILLADTPLGGAKIFAENLRKTIESEKFSIPEGKVLQITASMGLAEFPSHGLSSADLIKHADDALYRAKREGRNLWRAFTA